MCVGMKTHSCRIPRAQGAQARRAVSLLRALFRSCCPWAALVTCTPPMNLAGGLAFYYLTSGKRKKSAKVYLRMCVWMCVNACVLGCV